MNTKLCKSITLVLVMSSMAFCVSTARATGWINKAGDNIGRGVTITLQNPSKGVLMISTALTKDTGGKPVYIKVYDPNGKEITKGDANVTESKVMLWDFGELEKAGEYTIQLTTYDNAPLPGNVHIICNRDMKQK